MLGGQVEQSAAMPACGKATRKYPSGFAPVAGAEQGGGEVEQSLQASQRRMTAWISSTSRGMDASVWRPPTVPDSAPRLHSAVQAWRTVTV